MEDVFARNKIIYGKEYLSKLQDKHVAVFGLGGVGGFALESLVRAGIKHFTLVDFDTVSPSNINRQLIALQSTIGAKKTELFKQRLLDINHKIELRIFDNFYTEELNDKIFDTKIDYIIDAIDTMKSKLSLLQFAHNNNIPVATSLGAGNRKDPTKFYICDISEIETVNDNFAKNILRQLKKRGIISGIKAVCSHEQPIKSEKNIEETQLESGVVKKLQIGSTPFAPAIAGYYLGYIVINDLL